ncbi:MAG: sigma-70 family RNA polymerase sigma factor [Actinobacteria bacterium]|nr:sigma-70 family RNA polymerase sigma factor [Actinomycetota bacterium]
MDEQQAAADELAARFETHRATLRGVAYRLLGSLAEADDAVQEAWFRLSRADAGAITSLEAWLRTTVARICLDMLRTRAVRREEPLDGRPPAAVAGDGPEQEAVLVDAVGRAMLVVLDTLAPAERVAFVLHDLFSVPFRQIGPILDRNEAATKQLASRARRRVRGVPAVPATELARQRPVVEAFLAATRDGDLGALLAVLAPDVVRRADVALVGPGRATELRGAGRVGREMAVFGGRSRYAAPALVNGTVGAVVAPRGRLLLVIAMTVAGDRVAGYELIADPARLGQVELAVLDA